MQGFLELYHALVKDQNILKLGQMIDELLVKTQHLSPEKFFFSPEYEHIKECIKEINLTHIQRIGNELPEFQKKMALILKTNKYFTLAFLMLPKGDKFAWHDHPHMNAFNRYIFGKMSIKSLSKQKFKKKGDQIFYEKMDERNEYFDGKQSKNLSIVDPHHFNIHQIIAEEQSGFLDFMIPHYPKKICTCYETIKEDKNSFQLKELPAGYSQKIIFLAEYIMSN